MIFQVFFEFVVDLFNLFGYFADGGQKFLQTILDYSVIEIIFFSGSLN